MKNLKKIINLFIMVSLLVPNLYATPTSPGAGTTKTDIKTTPSVSEGFSKGETKTETKDLDYTTWKDANVYEKTDTKLKNPLLNLFETTQWNLFIKEFEMTLNFDWCCKKNDPLTCAFGVQAHMIEPIGYMETTKKPLYFPFADLDLGGNIIKGGYMYDLSDENTMARGVVYDAHFIYVPIMGMIFKKTMSFVCFHEGDLLIPYLSEFDPSWKMDIYYIKLIPHMIYMFTPQGLVNSLFDCISTEVVNAMTMTYGGNFDKESSATASSAIPKFNKETLTTMTDTVKTKGQKKSVIGDYTSPLRTKLNVIRDTMYHLDGCSGYSPVGGYVDGVDPLLDATLQFHGIMSLLHGMSALSPVPFLYKQSNALIEGSSLPNASSAQTAEQAAAYKSKLNVQNSIDTMCKWKDFPLPLPSQYLLQLAYPTTGSAKEVGASGITVSTAKNVPASYGSAFSVWVRRDYYAFAYFCKKEDWDNKKKGKGGL